MPEEARRQHFYDSLVLAIQLYWSTPVLKCDSLQGKSIDGDNGRWQR